MSNDNDTLLNVTTISPIIDSVFTPTTFITSFLDDNNNASDNDESFWDNVFDYELYGWNVLFLEMCILLLFVSYNFGKSKVNLHSESPEIECTATGTSQQGQMHPDHLFITPPMTDRNSLAVKKTSITEDYNINSYNISAIRPSSIIPNHIEKEELNQLYRNDFKYPNYYYLIQFIYFVSTFIEYIVLLYYIDIEQFNISYIYVLLFSYLFVSYLFINNYGFCQCLIQLIQLNIFLYFCNWNIFSFIIFISIYIFQLTSLSIIGMINNDVFDVKQFKRHLTKNGKSKKCMKLVSENTRFAILFGNFELLPLLIIEHNYKFTDILMFGEIAYDSIWYQFLIILIIWLTSLMPFYIKYMLRFGRYFNPQKNVNHAIMAIYYRLYIIISILWKLYNIYLCSMYIYNNYFEDDANDDFVSFTFIYNIFVVVINILIIFIFIPFCLSFYKCLCWCTKCKFQCCGRRCCRKCCGGDSFDDEDEETENGFLICCAWFFCCKLKSNQV